MAPNLQGLNVVYPHEPTEHMDSAADLLSSSSQYPNQLDLWSSLNFDAAEESSFTAVDSCDKHPVDLDEERAAGVASHEHHEHPVTGHDITHFPSPRETVSAPGNFDVNGFLSSFGIDTNRMPPAFFTPSLAQLLSSHSAPGSGFSYPPPPELFVPERSAAAAAAPTSTDAPAPKRARTRKNSTATTEPVDEDEDGPAPLGPGGVPISAAEDKRRRNTAASARFRMKKKEREQALEGKAKELETKVEELERECEGLRRENGWLKGLVVGVTGGPPTAMPPSIAGMKRGREKAL